ERLEKHAIDRQRLRRLVVGEDFSVAVHDQTALRRRHDLAQRIRLGQHAVLVRLQSLHEPERSGEEDEHDDVRPQQYVDAEVEELLIVSVYAHGSPAGGSLRGLDRLFTQEQQQQLIDEHPEQQREDRLDDESLPEQFDFLFEQNIDEDVE